MPFAISRANVYEVSGEAVKGLFWLGAGIALGIYGYRCLKDQRRQIPGIDRIDAEARKFGDSAKAFADSGRQLADAGWQFADAARANAGPALETVQDRGREMVGKAKARGSELRRGLNRVREQVREGD